MIEGKTKNGFKYKIDERVTQDWRLMKLIAMSESSDPSEQIKGAAGLVSLILGDQEDELMKFLEKKHKGYVPTTAVTDVVSEIMSQVRELKNS